MKKTALNNRTVVITRDVAQATTTIDEIEKYGGHPVLFPTIKIVRLEDRSEIRKAVENIQRYDWLIFTSTNTVNCFDELFQLKAPGALGAMVAAIGDKTAEILLRRNMAVDLVPDTFSSAGLIEAFRLFDLDGARILQPCSRIARTKLADGLRSLGATVDQISIYDTIPNRDLDATALTRSIQKNETDCLVFFSPSAFNYFADIVGDKTMNHVRDTRMPVAAIGRTTARAIEACGLTNVLVPPESSEESLVTTIAGYFDTIN